MTTNNEFSTSDLALATALSLWQKVEDIDRSNPRKALFIFMRTEELEKLIDAYFRDELTVSPQAYFNQMRAIKARLYSEER